MFHSFEVPTVYLDMMLIVSNVSVEVDDVDRDKCRDDERPLIQKLLSPVMQVQEPDLKVK